MSTPTLTVWLYLDSYSSGVMHDKADEWNDDHPDQSPKTGQDLEYEEAEKCFRDAFPEHKVVCQRDKRPHELANAAPAFYVFDIGGMDFSGYGTGNRANFAAEVVRQIEDHPNTIFVPWSAFSFRYAEGALADLLGEDAWLEKKIPPNVLFLDDKEIYAGILEETIMARLKTLYQARGNT